MLKDGFDAVGRRNRGHAQPRVRDNRHIIRSAARVSAHLQPEERPFRDQPSSFKSKSIISPGLLKNARDTLKCSVSSYGTRIGPEFAKHVNPGVRIGHDDRRMRRDDDCARAFAEAVQQCQETHLPRRRQRGFRLVEQIQAGAVEAVLEKREK